MYAELIGIVLATAVLLLRLAACKLSTLLQLRNLAAKDDAKRIFLELESSLRHIQSFNLSLMVSNKQEMLLLTPLC
uniref:Uncharacterized protein n=1 Tax=Tetranychus urticae TaxID=32264 RepID=T1L538_TETUR